MINKLALLFLLFFTSNVTGTVNQNECDNLTQNEYFFNKQTYIYDKWDLKIRDAHKDHDDCIKCPPYLKVGSIHSDAYKKGLDGYQLVEINGENFLNYNDSQEFISAAEKIIEENKNLDIKVIIDDEYYWDLHDEDFSIYDNLNINQASIDRKYESPLEVAYELSIEDFRVENKSTNTKILLNLDYYFFIDEFSSYLNKNIDEKLCSFTDKDQIEKISKNILIPKIFVVEEMLTIDGYKDLEKKRSIKEIDIYQVEGKYKVHVSESILADTNPFTQFEKFPFDKITTQLNLLPLNFVFSPFNYEYLDNFEQETMDYISMNEWNLSDINIDEIALSEEIMNEFDETYKFDPADEMYKLVFEDDNSIDLLSVEITLAREYQFYILKIIIPVIFIVLISFSTFWIRNDQIEAKLNLAIVSLLALIAYNFIVNTEIPKISKITILDGFILVSYLYTGLCSLLSVYSYYDYRRDRLTGDFNPIDVKLRYLAPLTYFLSLFVISMFIYFKILFFS